MHPSEGELRAFHDHELSAAEQGWIEGHLATCAACQERATELHRRAIQARRRLAALAPEQPPLSAREARARLATYPGPERKRTPMNLLPSVRPLRPLWGGLVAATLLLLALLLPPVRVLATDFLGLFRIQRIEVVEVGPDALPEPFSNTAVQVEQLLADQLQVEPRGDPADAASAEEASRLAGFPVRLPAAATGEGRLRVQPGARLTLTIDLPRVRALLRELGHAEVELPDSLDGERVVVDIPSAVTAAYGSCEESEASEPDAPCVVLLQLPSPTVTAPPDLDMDRLGAAFLQLMGRDAADAALLSQQVDWSTTLVVPIPSSYTDYEEVQVDGVPGILIEKLIDEGEPRFMLLWVRGEIVYALLGSHSADEALTLADSLQ